MSELEGSIVETQGGDGAVFSRPDLGQVLLMCVRVCARVRDIQGAVLACAFAREYAMDLLYFQESEKESEL